MMCGYMTHLDTMPSVTVLSSPTGLPTAITQSPTCRHHHNRFNYYRSHHHDRCKSDLRIFEESLPIFATRADATAVHA